MMKELSSAEVMLFRTGGILVLSSLMLRVLYPLPGLIIFGVGSVLFSLMLLRNEYLGTDFVIRRLRRQQLLGSVFLLGSVVFLTCQHFRLGMFQRNEWVVSLAISAVILLYTSWRIPSELSKSE